MLRCVIHSMQGPLHWPECTLTPWDQPGWGAAGALPTLARILTPRIPPPLVTLLGEVPSFWSSRTSWLCPGPCGDVCVCLPSLQWNFIQAGAAKALGQALQLNTSLTSLE